LEDGWDCTEDLDDVCNAANRHAYDNCLVPTDMNICPPTTEDWDNVCEEDEQQGQARCGLKAHSQCACGFLCVSWRSTRSITTYEEQVSSHSGSIDFLVAVNTIREDNYVPLGNGNSTKLEKTVLAP
jgi:hypothetical protein